VYVILIDTYLDERFKKLGDYIDIACVAWLFVCISSQQLSFNDDWEGFTCL